MNKSTVKLTASQNDFTRLQTLQQAVEMPKGKLLTANLYQSQEIHLPLISSAEFDNLFPPTQKVFSLLDESTTGVLSNVGVNATVESAFLCTGVGILVSVPGQGFTVPGVVVPTPTTIQNTPCRNVCPIAATERVAALAWGYPAWSIIENFLAAYRVQMFVGRHFQVFDEAAKDLGLVTTVAEFEGASNSLISVGPFIRDINDVLDAKGAGRNFLPPTAAAAATGTGSTCLGAPTAAVTWGAPRILGVMKKFYEIHTAILYTPGMQLDFRFVLEEGDACFRAAMKRDAVYDPNNRTTYSAHFSATSDCLVDGAVDTIPGGCMALGLVLAGYDVAPEACLEYYSNIMPGSALDTLYRQVGAGGLVRMLADPTLRGKLSGLPDGGHSLDRFLAGASMPQQ